MLLSSSLSLVCVLALYPAISPTGVYGQAPAADRRTYGSAHCRVETPKAWKGIGHVVWIGGCRKGYADGLGVLRRTDQEYGTGLFLGRVTQGLLHSGALDPRDGSEVGLWKDGTVPPNDWQTEAENMAYWNAMYRAYRDAERAAQITAQTMARHSNHNSARFYARLVRFLRMQPGE